MKRQSDFLLQHQHLFSAMYTETEKSDDPRKKDSSVVVELCVQLLRNSPYNLLYFICSKEVNVHWTCAKCQEQLVLKSFSMNASVCCEYEAKITHHRHSKFVFQGTISGEQYSVALPLLPELHYSELKNYRSKAICP